WSAFRVPACVPVTTASRDKTAYMQTSSGNIEIYGGDWIFHRDLVKMPMGRGSTKMAETSLLIKWSWVRVPAGSPIKSSTYTELSGRQKKPEKETGAAPGQHHSRKRSARLGCMSVEADRS